MKLWVKVTVAVVCCYAAVAGLFVFRDLFTSHSANEPERRALSALHDDLAIGDDMNTVLRKFYLVRNDKLDLAIHCTDPTNWVVSAPLEFTAHNWQMFIRLENGMVNSVRIRTQDGPNPKGGPSDKIAPTKQSSSIADPRHVSCGARVAPRVANAHC